MDFIPIAPLVSDAGATVAVFGIIFTVLVGVALAFGLFAPERGKGKPVYVALALAFSCLLVICALAVSSMGALAERQLDIHDAFKGAYGLNLDGDHLQALKYPALEPSGGYVEYGSTTYGGERLTLVWTGERLELGTGTRGEFTEFERADG